MPSLNLERCTRLPTSKDVVSPQYRSDRKPIFDGMAVLKVALLPSMKAVYYILKFSRLMGTKAAPSRKFQSCAAVFKSKSINGPKNSDVKSLLNIRRDCFLSLL